MECKLYLVTARRGEKSYMKDLFVSPPFRVVSVGQLESDGGAYLMVMSTSPGILDGDSYHLDIRVEEGARLQLQSQSYQRLFQMEGRATQEMHITLGPNASFSQVPYPIVPHTNSSFHSMSRVEMADGCTFLQSEIITCGRKHHGEAFCFREFHNRVEVYHEGRLLLKDNVWLIPSQMPLLGLGLLEGFTHQGTLICLNTRKVSVSKQVELIYEQLSEEKEIEFGISLTQTEGFVLRLLGQGGEQLYRCFRQVQELMWRVDSNTN